MSPTPKPQPVRLCERDLKLAHYMAEKRNVNEEHFGPRTFGNRGRDSYQTHLEGALGELMVAQYYGLEPDLYFEVKGGGRLFDNEWNGYTIEVKTTSHFGVLRHGLMVAKHRFKNADVYFLVRARAYEHSAWGLLVGWTTGRVVGSKTPIRPDGREDLPLTYIVPESELRECNNERRFSDRNTGRVGYDNPKRATREKVGD